MLYSRETDTFLTVVEEGSFLKASKKLFLTPASVMNQINKFETQAGVKLLERTNQGVRLTAAGRLIHKEAVRIVKISDQAVAHAREIARNEQAVIRVGTSILRPCRTLVELWAEADDGTLPVTIHIVPFEDTPAGMEAMLSSLGKEIDCFVSPCDSLTWKENYGILILRHEKCALALPRKHRLAKKEKLDWPDLKGETIMLVKRGESPILNRMRDEIETDHPQTAVLNTPHFYDTSSFNECEQMGCLMETLDLWKDVHPSLVTIPMEWEYEMPYGIIYAKNPSPVVEKFIGAVSRYLEHKKTEVR